MYYLQFIYFIFIKNKIYLALLMSMQRLVIKGCVREGSMYCNYLVYIPVITAISLY